MIIIGLSLLGLVISMYAILLERKIAKNPSYKPMCDVSDTVSCTKLIKSSYAHMLYFSNATWGIAYYALVLLLAALNLPRLLVLVTTGGVIASLVLAYILFFKIRSVCLVCISLYLVNILLFLASLKHLGIW
jgi:vitamin-K-epoxide reductase (warfarin-sensitive)